MSTSALLLVVCLASAVLTLALDAGVVVTGTATFRNVADVESVPG